MDRVLAVYRENEFSPGKVDADAAILDSVLAHLASQGFVATAVAPEEFIRHELARYDLLLAMCQGELALGRLSAFQAGGALVINSPQAIRSCYRDRLGQILKAAAPVPDGILVATSIDPDALDGALGSMHPERGIYVKRGDLHALFAGDVRRIDDRASLVDALGDFAGRGIGLAYLQAAVEGRVVKFYGVTGTGYFSVADSGSGAAVPARLKDAAQAAAMALGLEVWGGDAIVNGGSFKIVDFNDWPSFERVRAQAAAAIARRALELVKEVRGEGNGARGRSN
jgi:hypothetical protein